MLGDLLHAAFRSLRHRWSEQLAPLEITPHQSRALSAVDRSSGADGTPGVRLKDLAEALRIAPRSATEVVDQLADKGLVERTPDPTDRRATRIVLTEAGTQLRRQVTEVRQAEAGDYFSTLSAEERADLARILGRLVKAQVPQ